MVKKKIFYCRFIIPEDRRAPQWIPVAAFSPEAALRRVRSGTDAPVEVRTRPPKGEEVIQTRAWIDPVPSDTRKFDGKRYVYSAGDPTDLARVKRLAQKLRERGYLARIVRTKDGGGHVYRSPNPKDHGGRS